MTNSRCLYIITLITSVLFAVALCSCCNNYPAYLVQVDSLLLCGDYGKADSLLACYDKTPSEKEAICVYRQLLDLECRFVNGTLNSADFSMADSLYRYYDNKMNHEEALAQLILGDIYKSERDYSSALNCYLKTEAVVNVLNDFMLKIWVNRAQGDIYYEQGMYADCIDYYKKYYATALQRNDTLRIAQSSIYMGRVYIISNDVDSVLYYLHQAIALSEGLSPAEKNDIVTPAKSTLADIYTQIGEYEKAASLMTRHDIDNENWAYWHLAQSHTDSAYWYFNHLTETDSWRAKVEYLPILARLEERRGNSEHSRILYRDLAIAKDSLKAHSQIEETHKVKMLHELNQIKRERDKAQKQSAIRGTISGIISLVTVVIAIVAYIFWRRNQKQKEIDLVQKKQLWEEERLMMLKKLDQSPLRERIKQNAGKENFHLTENEWQQLATLIDNANNQFTNRLRTLYDGITEYDLRICYLIKLDVPSVAIGVMLYKSKAAIGMARMRLYEKLMGETGTAKQLNDFIKDF